MSKQIIEMGNGKMLQLEMEGLEAFIKVKNENGMFVAVTGRTLGAALNRADSETFVDLLEKIPLSNFHGINNPTQKAKSEALSQIREEIGSGWKVTVTAMMDITPQKTLVRVESEDTLHPIAHHSMALSSRNGSIHIETI
jgi:hypothetical protein